MAVNVDAITARVKKANPPFHAAIREIGKAIVGQEKMVQSMVVALLSDGHLIVEGLPGLAKTLAVNTLAKVIRCDFKRIQFTPDLLPADLLGTSIYNPKGGSFSVSKGPIFTNILLADEINRAPAKVQSALLEVMQERQVTIGKETFVTGAPYMVLATQNPIEHEGTYPLPEAQTDRFMMKVQIDYPTRDEEKLIVTKMATLGKRPEVQPVLDSEGILAAREVVNEIYLDDKVMEYILDIVFATRTPVDFGVDIEGLLLFGASPRASMMLKIAGKAHAFLAGRGYVTPHDIKHVVHDILRHRLRLSYEAEAENISADDIVDQILEKIPVP